MTRRDAYLRKKYEITEEEFLTLLKFNGGRCWICGRKQKGSLNVDHDHHVAKKEGLRASIRGLLCFPCNKKVIGRHRRQHAEIYRRAALYLTEWAHRTQEYLTQSCKATGGRSADSIPQQKGNTRRKVSGYKRSI